MLKNRVKLNIIDCPYGTEYKYTVVDNYQGTMGIYTHGNCSKFNQDKQHLYFKQIIDHLGKLFPFVSMQNHIIQRNEDKYSIVFHSVMGDCKIKQIIVRRNKSTLQDLAKQLNTMLLNDKGISLEIVINEGGCNEE